MDDGCWKRKSLRFVYGEGVCKGERNVRDFDASLCTFPGDGVGHEREEASVGVHANDGYESCHAAVFWVGARKVHSVRVALGGFADGGGLGEGVGGGGGRCVRPFGFELLDGACGGGGALDRGATFVAPTDDGAKGAVGESDIDSDVADAHDPGPDAEARLVGVKVLDEHSASERIEGAHCHVVDYVEQAGGDGTGAPPGLHSFELGVPRSGLERRERAGDSFFAADGAFHDSHAGSEFDESAFEALDVVHVEFLRFCVGAEHV